MTLLCKLTQSAAAAALIACATNGYATAEPAASEAGAAPTADMRMVARGRYIVQIAGCNDCHTPGYAQTGGNIPETDWLIGDTLGWRGPWGTTYPPNLRLFMQKVSEAEWVKIAHTAQFRPPMPWPQLHHMSEQDLRAIYHFVRSLGPAGEPAPPYLPPGQEPRGPYVSFPEPPQ